LGKVNRGTLEYENNVPNHSEGWLNEIVGDDRPEDWLDGYKMTFRDAIRDEVEDYLYECAPVLWSTDENDTDEPGSTIWDVLNSLNL